MPKVLKVRQIWSHWCKSIFWTYLFYLFRSRLYCFFFDISITSSSTDLWCRFLWVGTKIFVRKKIVIWGVAAIAPSCRLRIQSCSPGFKSHAHHLCCFQFVLELILEWDNDKNEKRTKKRKRRRNLPIFLKKIAFLNCVL